MAEIGLILPGDQARAGNDSARIGKNSAHWSKSAIRHAILILWWSSPLWVASFTHASMPSCDVILIWKITPSAVTRSALPVRVDWASSMRSRAANPYCSAEKVRCCRSAEKPRRSAERRLGGLASRRLSLGGLRDRWSAGPNPRGGPISWASRIRRARRAR